MVGVKLLNNRAIYTTSAMRHLSPLVSQCRWKDLKCSCIISAYLVIENMGIGVCVFLCVYMCVWVCVHACPVPLVRVWLIHETEFVCGMPARHSCCMQMRKEWKWICKSEIKTARGHDYNEQRKKKNKKKNKENKTNKKKTAKKQALVQQQMVSDSSRGDSDLDSVPEWVFMVMLRI